MNETEEAMLREATEAYSAWVRHESPTASVQQPSSSLSEVTDRRVYLRNVNGELARFAIRRGKYGVRILELLSAPRWELSGAWREFVSSAAKLLHSGKYHPNELKREVDRWSSPHLAPWQDWRVRRVAEWERTHDDE